MSYIIALVFLIAPFSSAASVNQQKPDTSVKQGAVQESTGQQPQGNTQKQPSTEIRQVKKPGEAAVIYNDCSVQAPAAQTEKQETYNPRKDTLYRAYLWFTILGVPIALGGLFFIYRQVRHTSRQTGHLERQINIQQRSSRQWVNILEWRQHAVEGMNQTVGVYFQIENPTKVPLRLDHVRCSVLGQHQDSMLGTFLAPDNPFPHEFLASLNMADWTSYGGSGVVLEAEVSVFFTDAFDNHWNQIFQTTLLCGFHNHTLHVRERRTIMRRDDPHQN